MEQQGLNIIIHTNIFEIGSLISAICAVLGGLGGTALRYHNKILSNCEREAQEQNERYLSLIGKQYDLQQETNTALSSLAGQITLGQDFQKIATKLMVKAVGDD